MAVTEDTQQDILSELVKIRKLLETMQPIKPDSLDYLLKYPDPIRKTIIALADLGGKGTASDVAKITKRARAVESGILNELERREIVSGNRVGRLKYFTLKEAKNENRY